jgi:2-polyprenyl-6-hydroxyphenyl methylase/3-demethylubiquinone-9 3-methyltransferase
MGSSLASGPPADLAAQFDAEVQRGERFRFGRNWAAFLSGLSPARVAEAERSLRDMLERSSLHGLRFVDVGSGSGLFSLAARRLGAEVVSFDYDPQSVACTEELRRRQFPQDAQWRIERGSVLDGGFLRQLGTFDVVYSWGVLHHTGQMWTALQNVLPLVRPGGQLFIALYNDEGWKSRVWRRVKRLYCSGVAGRWLVQALFIPLFALAAVVKSLLTRRNEFARYRERRGMSMYYDWIDWLGGYPFEVARVEEVLLVCREHGFVLDNLRTTPRLGCNQFVFRLAPEGRRPRPSEGAACEAGP